MDRQGQRPPLDQAARRPGAGAGADVRQPGLRRQPLQRGVNWAIGVFSALKNPAGKGNPATFDGTTARATFYNTSTYTAAAGSWKAAYNAGFETGNHTINHLHGGTADNGMNFSAAGWTRRSRAASTTTSAAPSA